MFCSHESNKIVSLITTIRQQIIHVSVVLAVFRNLRRSKPTQILIRFKGIVIFFPELYTSCCNVICLT